MSNLAVSNSNKINVFETKVKDNSQPVSAKNNAVKLGSDKIDLSDTLKGLLTFDKPFEKTTIPKAKPVNGDFSTLTADNENDISGEIRFFFFSDAHSRFHMLDKFIEQTNDEKPALVLDGGDMVHDGTEPELLKAYADRKKIDVPVYMATGNHDVHLRGPFKNPPPSLPEFHSFDSKGVHFVLLDNEDETLSDEQFRMLEEDLKANQGKPMIVAMHVPPMLDKESGIVKWAKKLPLNFASPTMKDPEQVKKFTGLMSQYGVTAVLTGHTHAADYLEKDGVKYINAGAVGGLTPGWGIDNEYLDIKIKDGKLDFERVVLKEGSDNPAMFLADSFKYYMDLNTFNHNNLGWNYIPSASVQLKAGGKVSENARGTSHSTTITASFERQKGDKAQIFGDATVSAGTRDLNFKLEGGYKYHVIGDYNKGVFVGGTVGANAGIVVGKPSAGVGAEISAGVDYKNFTFEVSHERATNYKATSASIGYRF